MRRDAVLWAVSRDAEATNERGKKFQTLTQRILSSDVLYKPHKLSAEETLTKETVRALAQLEKHNERTLEWATPT